MIERLTKLKEDLYNIKIKQAIEQEKKKGIEKELKEKGFTNLDDLESTINSITNKIRKKELNFNKKLDIIDLSIRELG